MATTNKLQKSSNGVTVTNLTDSQIYDNGTNIGIGTTNPSYKLDVLSSGNKVQAIFGKENSSQESQILLGSGLSNDQLMVMGMDPSSGYGYLQTYGADTGSCLVLKRNVSEGYVGIGTTNPQAKLDVKGSVRLGWDNAVSNPGPTIIMVPSPTNSAATNRANIQAAIDQAALNGGGTVMLQKGKYLLEEYVVSSVRKGYCILLKGGVRLMGAGIYATTLDAANSDCHVIMSDPAQYISGNGWAPKPFLYIKDLQVLAGPNSGTHTAVYINGAILCFIENVCVYGNYNSGTPGYKFNRGIHVKGWCGTLINCQVQECYQGFNLSWDDDLGGNPADNTNAIEVVGCHYEGGNLPPPTGGSLVGFYINGFSNHLSGTTIERRLGKVEYPVWDTTGIHIKEDSGNTLTGCYFEGWKTTYKLDGCKQTNIVGGYISSVSGIDSIQFLNGSDSIESCNSIQNVCQSIWNYTGTAPNGEWVFVSMGAIGKTTVVNLVSTGNVGIGVANPNAPLQIGSGNVSSPANVLVESYSTSKGTANFVGNWTSSGRWGIGPLSGSANNTIQIGNVNDQIGNWNSIQNANVVVGGNIGIGTNNPLWKLDICGGQLGVRPITNSPGLITVLPSADGNWWNIANINNGAKFVISIGDKRNANDTTDWNIAALVISGDGKVGIGTTSPQQKLEVNGPIRVNNTDAALELWDTSGDQFRIQNWNGVFCIINQTDSNRIDFQIDGDGKVGIGKTSPGSKLAVYGLIAYANNAAAIAAGLSAGDFYRTPTGVVMVVY